MSLKEASSLAPQLDLAGIISALAPKDFDVTRVIVSSPKYLKALAPLLNETDSDVLQHFFVWKTVQALYHFVDAPEVKPYKAFVNVLAGKVGHSPIPRALCSH